MQIKTHIVEDAIHGEIVHRKHHFFLIRAGSVRTVVTVPDFPADHFLTHGVGIDVLPGQGVDVNPIPHNQHLIAQSLDFIQIVGNDNYGGALFLLFVDDLINPIPAFLRQGGSSFIDNQNPGLLAERAGSFNHLSVFKRIGFNGLFGIHIAQPIFVQNPPGELVQLAHADIAHLGKLILFSQKHIFRHRHTVNGTLFLGEILDSGLPGIQYRFWMVLLAQVGHGAFGGGIYSGNHAGHG